MTSARVLLLACMATVASASDLPSFSKCAVLESEPAVDQRFERLARDKVTANLRDPESARFVGYSVHARAVCAEGPHDLVCGRVNAKNGFGGYTGAQSFAFIATGNNYAILFASDSDVPSLDARAAVLKLCAEADKLRPK